MGIAEMNRPERANPPLLSRANVLGVGINATNIGAATLLSDTLIRQNRRAYVCTADVHTIIEAQSDPYLREVLNASFMTVPDGMPLVWAARMQGFRQIQRVYGPDFMLALCRFGVPRGYRHFFCGGKPGVAGKLSTNLVAEIPGLQVVGTYTPPYRALNPAEEAELAGRIAISRPNVVWVGLGSPKQDRFLAQYCGRFETNLMVGVGAAFDFHAGVVKEAPRWMHKTGLQWIYRVVQEPRRLWKRYCISVPSFLWKIGLQFSGLRAFSSRISTDCEPIKSARN
ncbi:MAG: WecB/TagA/CpsF family glycosyltransferase [Terracidiphilus sp.]